MSDQGCGKNQQTTGSTVEGSEAAAQGVIEEEREKSEAEEPIRHKLSTVYSHDSAS